MSWEWLSQNAVGLITLLAVGVGMRTLWGRIDVLKEKVEAQAQMIQGLKDLLDKVEKFSGRWWKDQLEAYKVRSQGAKPWRR